MVASLISSIVDNVFGMLGKVPAARRDEKRKAILRDTLGDERYTWRSIGTLSRLIGETDEDRTRDLLISIGARASTGSSDEEMWGLISRVGTG
jgi:hypothetical protein